MHRPPYRKRLHFTERVCASVADTSAYRQDVFHNKHKKQPPELQALELWTHARAGTDKVPALRTIFLQDDSRDTGVGTV